MNSDVNRTVIELERVRQRGRRLLFVQRWSQWWAVMVVTMLSAGGIDFLLRLPGWVRLIVGVGVGVSALVWLVHRTQRVVRFKPDLAMLALRAERLFPHLSGQLAASVDFAMHASVFEKPATTHAMAQSSIRQAHERLGQERLDRLLDPTRTIRSLVLAMLLTVMISGVVFVAPASSVLAAKRWVLPLGDAQWPRRTEIVSTTRAKVWPDDTPIRLQARVERGYRDGMRMWVVYRLDEDQSWRQALLNEQGVGGRSDSGEAQATRAAQGAMFEVVLELSHELASLVTTAEDATREMPAVPTLQYYFTAGDDRTEEQQMLLVPRPKVESVRVVIDPPAYASSFIESQALNLNEQPGVLASAVAMQGSRVRMVVGLNKQLGLQAGESDAKATAFNGSPVLDEALRARLVEMMPGLAQRLDVQFQLDDAALSLVARPTLTAEFTLDQTMQTTIDLVDEYGLASTSLRRYRIEAVADGYPTVTLREPVADESVLATAMIPVSGSARDDVSLGWMGLELQLHPENEPVLLGEQAMTKPRGLIEQSVDLTPYQLTAGDEIVLFSAARDVGPVGTIRDVVRSAPRRLRIIDEATLIGQLRADLAALRQQAIRLAERQEELIHADRSAARYGQREVARHVEAKVELVEALNARAARNRLDEASLLRMLEQSQQLMEATQQSAARAADRLKQAEAMETDQAELAKALDKEARADQRQTADRLAELVSLLDQGRDALSVQLQVRQLSTKQAQLAQQMRQFMPKTLGRSLENLSDEERAQLEDFSEQQKALSNQAEALLQQMQMTAESLRKQQPSNPAQQATAESLSSASAIAQRQGLSQTMQDAAAQTSENRLADAGSSQAETESTLNDMLEELQQQDKRQQEVLKRLLMALADAIERLIEQQTAQIERLNEEKVVLSAMEMPLSLLRRNTLSVGEQAASEPSTRDVALMLRSAADYQGAAIKAIRNEQSDQAKAQEQTALEKLQEALALVHQTEEAREREQQDQQRHKLREQYQKLAAQQRDIHERTGTIVTADDAARVVTRKARRELVRLSHEEADLAEAVSLLSEEVDQTLVFMHLHGQIERTLEQVVQQLRLAQASARVLDDQLTVAMMLDAMAVALEEDQSDSEFNEGGGSGGGGGGSGGQAPPLVPPLAELKLVRGLQVAIYEQTKALDKQAGQADQANNEDASSSRQALLELGARQRELAGLGQQLIEKMQETMGPSGGGE